MIMYLKQQTLVSHFNKLLQVAIVVQFIIKSLKNVWIILHHPIEQYCAPHGSECGCMWRLNK